MDRVLIVNADDFGQSAAISRGIRRAHKEGVVTSTSLMVHWPASAEAAEHSDGLDLGLHIDLGEWRYCDGSWRALYQRVEPTDTSAIQDELHLQLNEFRRLTGKSPSHLDSHQHVHLHEPVLSIAKQIADDLDIPLRGCSSIIAYCGEFYGQTGRGESYPDSVSVDALVRLVQRLPEGVTELACHPGEEDQNGHSTYCSERPLELNTLCHPRLRDAVRDERIRLCTFAELTNDCSIIRHSAIEGSMSN
jgi:predicted glycoside hydrolase/deacetylase ChbG (UPF0249 family)